jgi:hypothetical protein
LPFLTRARIRRQKSSAAQHPLGGQLQRELSHDLAVHLLTGRPEALPQVEPLWAAVAWDPQDRDAGEAAALRLFRYPTTRAVRDRDGYVIDGQKMWVTNGGTSTLVAVLVKTDEAAESVYRNMTTFLAEKKQGFGEAGPGLVIPGKIEKMGYKGVDTTELIFAGYRTSHEQILGGTPGRGFYLMMDGIEVGRVNVTARAAASRCARSSSPSATLSCAPASASRSPSTRRYSSGSRRWRPRSRPHTR